MRPCSAGMVGEGWEERGELTRYHVRTPMKKRNDTSAVRNRGEKAEKYSDGVGGMPGEGQQPLMRASPQFEHEMLLYGMQYHCGIRRVIILTHGEKGPANVGGTRVPVCTFVQRHPNVKYVGRQQAERHQRGEAHEDEEAECEHVHCDVVRAQRLREGVHQDVAQDGEVHARQLPAQR